MTQPLTDPKSQLFEIDYKRLVLLLLPTFLRQSRLFALVSALISEIRLLHGKFIENRNKNIERLQYNGQVCYLCKLLNDKLDPQQRRITITDEHQEGEWLTIYDETQSYQTFTYTLPGSSINQVPIVWNETKIDQDAASFTVTVPWADEKNIETLKTLLNAYKLISQKYQINFKINE